MGTDEILQRLGVGPFDWKRVEAAAGVTFDQGERRELRQLTAEMALQWQPGRVLTPEERAANNDFASEWKRQVPKIAKHAPALLEALEPLGGSLSSDALRHSLNDLAGFANEAEAAIERARPGSGKLAGLPAREVFYVWSTWARARDRAGKRITRGCHYSDYADGYVGGVVNLIRELFRQAGCAPLPSGGQIDGALKRAKADYDEVKNRTRTREQGAAKTEKQREEWMMEQERLLAESVAEREKAEKSKRR